MNVASPSNPVRLFLHIGAALSLFLLPSLLTAIRPATSATHDQFAATGLALAYAIVAAVLELKRTPGLKPRIWDHLLLAGAGFGAYAVAMLVLKVQVDRVLLLTGLATAVAYLGTLSLLTSRRQAITAAVGLTTILAIQGLAHTRPQLLSALSGGTPRGGPPSRLVDTAYYTLQLNFYDRLLDRCDASKKHCESARTGGAIASVGGVYLVASADGHLYVLEPGSTGGSLSARLLPHAVPLNSAEFVRDVGSKSVDRFRVTGLLAEQTHGRLRLFVAHHHWNGAQRCAVLRVSTTEVAQADFFDGTAKLNWQRVYDTEPCLAQHEGKTFYGDESGGRLIRIGDRELLLSVGDLSMDGMAGGQPAAQDPASAYGKTILIDPATGMGRIYSIGHRNPQGLHIDLSGTIWSTEHGPRGGDELNVISEGKNYGWPFVTYGTHALSHEWPLSIDQGRHDGFELPVFTWVPSIATGNLIRVRGKLFPRWEGDLLVGSYKKILWRLHIREGRVVYAEPIGIRDQNARIRDIVEDEVGRLVLLIDGGSIAVVTPVSERKTVPDGRAGSDSMRGQLIFLQCASCHAVKDGTQHGLGPDLAGIAGRRIAGAAGFGYSSALSSKPGEWSDANLEKFLAAPEEFAPGTSMRFPGIADPSDRSKLISYLKTLRSTP